MKARPAQSGREQLAKLRNQGIVSKDEFEAKKKQLLGI